MLLELQKATEVTLQCVPVVNECQDGSADCAADAVCIDRADGYECRCRPGFVDASPQVREQKRLPRAGIEPATFRSSV